MNNGTIEDRLARLERESGVQQEIRHAVAQSLRAELQVRQAEELLAGAQRNLELAHNISAKVILRYA